MFQKFIVVSVLCLVMQLHNLTQILAQTNNLSPDLVTNLQGLASYKTFIAGKKVMKQTAIQLPQSSFLLVYVGIERTADKEMWSISPADGIVAKIFVYDNQKRNIETTKTEQLNKLLGADKFYQPNFCGGLGSFETWRVEKNKVILSQVYAPASEILDCSSEIYFDGKNILLSNTPNVVASDGLAGLAGKERNQKNEKALKLLQAQKLSEAIKIWEELYGYINNGSYSTEGKIDEFMNNLGFAYWKSKRYAEAEKVLLVCQTRFPTRYTVYINLADVYRDMKNKQKAIEYYTKITKFPVTAKQKEYANGELKKLKN